MKRLLLLLPIAALLGCTAESQDQLAQNAAKQAVRPILAERFPGVPLEGATDCIIDNATAREILILAADAATGPTASTVEITLNIASRPETIQCLVREGAALAAIARL